MSKKVLIMSASTGGGHNRAANAMKEEIEKRCINGEYIRQVKIQNKANSITNSICNSW